MRLSGQSDHLNALWSIPRDYNWSPHPTTSQTSQPLTLPQTYWTKKRIKTSLNQLEDTNAIIPGALVTACSCPACNQQPPDPYTPSLGPSQKNGKTN
uniref:Uncharacterized protein n=1 Tax=Plectus sambesii TaxID=2011161 RepID=A0A914UGY0_9BILA